jgi:site-specific DNA recombinase
MKNKKGKKCDSMNAVIYCRVSTKEQVSNLSLDTQEGRCKELCERNGWRIVRVFREEGASAKTTQRQELQRMLAFCEAHKGDIGFVIVNDLSRFSRDLADSLALETGLNEIGIRLRSATEEVDETPTGRFMSNLKAVINQHDNDIKADRTKLGMKASIDLGRFPFKGAIGYENVGTASGVNLIPDAVRAPLIQKAFELIAERTMTQREVLNTVGKMGLTTRSGEDVTSQTFHRLLRNPIYAGWVVVPSWTIRQKGNFEPLVSQDLFDTVQHILDGKKQLVRPYLRNHADFPLKVFVTCGGCGVPITGSWSTGRTKKYAYYRCRTPSCRRINNLAADTLHRAFTDLLLQLQPERAHMGQFQEAVRTVWKEKHASADKMLSEANKKLSDAKSRKDALTDLALRGVMSHTTFTQQMERLEEEEANAKRDVEAAKVEHWDVEALLEFACKLVEQPARLWMQSPIDQRQRLQKVFFPSGVSFADGVFRTDVTGSFFSMFSPSQGEIDDLASPTGFEPVLPP